MKLKNNNGNSAAYTRNYGILYYLCHTSKNHSQGNLDHLYH